jgi:hypothetical protein
VPTARGEGSTLKGIRVRGATVTTPLSVSTQTAKPAEFARKVGSQVPREVEAFRTQHASLASALLILVIGVPLPCKAQPRAPDVGGSYDSTYGMPEAMELEEIARGVGNYRKRAVRTKAVVGSAAGTTCSRARERQECLGSPFPSW